MSDYLVKRARHNAKADMPHHASVSLIVEMADRIEELEAKLAKAVEALEFYADADNYEDQHKPESCGCCYYLHDAEIKEDEGAKARTTLAELKGEK
jgi:hypothetical protein